MKTKKMILKGAIAVTLPTSVVQFLYNMMLEEERVLGVKRNLSAIIYRSLKAAHPDVTQYNIDEIYSKRRRIVEVSTYKQPEDPLHLNEKSFDLMTDDEKIAYLKNYAKEQAL